MPMQKVCTQCSAAFDVTDEDLAFYDKVSPAFQGKKASLPAPTQCPDCRFRRRLAFRNERILYKRACDRTGKEVISMYASDSPYVVYATDAWWGDDWDAMDHGKDVDLSRPFFDQFKNLSRVVPRVALLNPKAENSPYCNFSDWNKNCHLVINSNGNEDSFYSTILVKGRSCCDCLVVVDTELSYECIDSTQCYNLKFSRGCHGCSDSQFLFECRGCVKSIGCVNLRNKELHVFNKPVTQEEFDALSRKLESRMELERFRKEFEAFRLSLPHQERHVIQCENVQGDHLVNCKNIRRSFDGIDMEDCAYCDIVGNAKNCMDCNSVQFNELCLESTSLVGNRCCFTAFCRSTADVWYSWDCHSCHDCFGCIGLKHKQYCILNKQYTKEEYEKLVPKIIERMKTDEEWGEFFSVADSPFAYNESVALEFFPQTHSDVIAKGWQWRQQKDEAPKTEKIIPAARLPDAIDDVPDDVLNWAITCKTTDRPFKITKQELDLYRKIQVPLPHFHPDERHRQRVALRNPLKLWSRKCAKCHKPIETSYAPEKPEIVYCEDCYLKEVY